MTPYTVVLCEIDPKKAARKSAKTVGKDSGGLTLCLETERQPYNWNLVKLPFLKAHGLAVHSNVFPYFTDLAMSSSL